MVTCGGTVACHIACNGARSQDCAPGTTCSGVCSGKPDQRGAGGAPVETGTDGGVKHKP
jgi:hypothetical protein